MNYDILNHNHLFLLAFVGWTEVGRPRVASVSRSALSYSSGFTSLLSQGWAPDGSVSRAETQQPLREASYGDVRGARDQEHLQTYILKCHIAHST